MLTRLRLIGCAIPGLTRVNDNNPFTLSSCWIGSYQVEVRYSIAFNVAWLEDHYRKPFREAKALTRQASERSVAGYRNVGERRPVLPIRNGVEVSIDSWARRHLGAA